MTEVKKKKGKGLKIFLIIVVLIALVVFGYIKYLDGAFNNIFSRFEFTKNLVVQDLDFDDIPEDGNHVEEVELYENCHAKLLVDDDNLVKVVQVEKNVTTDSYAMPMMEAAKQAVKVFKGVEFDYEVYDDNKLNIYASFAPGDIDDGLFDKAQQLGFCSQEEIDLFKSYLSDPTVENINELINILF